MTFFVKSKGLVLAGLVISKVLCGIYYFFEKALLTMRIVLILRKKNFKLKLSAILRSAVKLSKDIDLYKFQQHCLNQNRNTIHPLLNIAAFRFFSSAGLMKDGLEESYSWSLRSR